MNYYQLYPIDVDKKWGGYENPDPYLWGDGEELNELFLCDLKKRWDFKTLEYVNLAEGKKPPIHSIGCTFIIFDADIPNVKSIGSSGVQLFPIINSNSLSNKYYVMNVYKEVDCVDWERSEVDKWPDGQKLEEWHNKRGRFFLNPVLMKDKIPTNLEAFRLQEWGSAFNIIISEKLKEKICALDFDHSFLVFKQLEVL